MNFYRITTTEDEPKSILISIDPNTEPDLEMALVKAISVEIPNFTGEVKCEHVNRMPNEDIIEQDEGLRVQTMRLNLELRKLTDFRKFLKKQRRIKFKILNKLTLNVEAKTNSPQLRVSTGGDESGTILPKGSTSKLEVKH